MKKNIAIFASGTGSNARKIVEHFEHQDDFSVSLVVSNKATAPVLDMAREKDIDTLVISRAY
ncbi:MAG: formyltransferase family protein, partial [Saprospiraceae bacterium]